MAVALQKHFKDRECNILRTENAAAADKDAQLPAMIALGHV